MQESINTWDHYHNPEGIPLGFKLYSMKCLAFVIILQATLLSSCEKQVPPFPKEAKEIIKDFENLIELSEEAWTQICDATKSEQNTTDILTYC